jgi:hypothetical protein
VAEQPLEDLLARLERERLEADRLYNDALTASTARSRRCPASPTRPRRYDDDKLYGGQHWGGRSSRRRSTGDRSLKGRLRGFIWRLVGPPIEAQQRFNAELVVHLNRNVAVHHEVQQTTSALVDAARREFAALVRFESSLVQYLQTITTVSRHQGPAGRRRSTERARRAGGSADSGV